MWTSLASCCAAAAIVVGAPAAPVELGNAVTVVKLDVEPIGSALRGAAGGASQHAILRIDGITADRQPGIGWEIYAGPRDVARDPRGPAYVGTLSLFGAGIRDEARGALQPAHVVFALGAAIRAAPAAWKRGEVFLTFVPRGNDVDGRPSIPHARARVRIASITTAFESR